MEAKTLRRQGIKSGAGQNDRRRGSFPEPTTQRKSTTMITKIKRFFKRQRRLAKRYPIAYTVRILIIAAIITGLVAGISKLTGTGRKDQEPQTTVETPEPTTTEEQTTQIEIATEETTTRLIGSMDWDADESYILAKMAMAEAESEDTECKALVILVILNRVWSDGFPDTIEGVITQRNAFTPYKNGRYDRVEPDADCWEALDLVMSGWDESQGALYFETTTDEETWHNTHLDRLFEHGALTFYKEK